MKIMESSDGLSVKGASSNVGQGRNEVRMSIHRKTDNRRP